MTYKISNHCCPKNKLNVMEAYSYRRLLAYHKTLAIVK